jgi:hypothetical protein
VFCRVVAVYAEFCFVVVVVVVGFCCAKELPPHASNTSNSHANLLFN